MEHAHITNLKEPSHQVSLFRSEAMWLVPNTHRTNPSEHPAMTKYNDWQLSISSMAHSDVRDINLISDKDCKSCFFRLLRWLLKRNEYSPRKTIGDDVILSPWQLSLSTSISDRSTRQHLSDARPPPEKRIWQFLSLEVLVLICSVGGSFGRGHVVALKARTLDIWPCAVKRQTHVLVERLTREICVKETIY